MPRKRTASPAPVKRPDPVAAATERLENNGLAAEVRRLLKVMSPERLERIEASIEKLADETRKAAEENRSFQATVRGAFALQQEQIAGLTDAARKHDKALARLEKHLEAYLRRVPPQLARGAVHTAPPDMGLVRWTSRGQSE